MGMLCYWVAVLFYSHLGERSMGFLRALALFRGGLRMAGERVKSGFMLPEVFKRTAPLRVKGRGRWRFKIARIAIRQRLPNL